MNNASHSDYTKTAANQFIHTQDLYEVLLTHFAPPWTTRFELHTLAQLARTCKATSDLALDTLWRTFITPSHILRLLPVDAYELVDTKYALVRPLVESDFEVFDQYAPRIRVADFSDPSRSMGCDLFSSLKAFRDPIFPRLLELRWRFSFDTVGAFQIISRGLPANAFSLSFSAGNLTSSRPRENAHPANPREVAPLLDQPLSSWFPDVQSLNLNLSIGTKHRAIGHVLEGLQSLTRLEHLTVNFPVGPSILAHLARLPHLLSLHLFEEDERCIYAAKQILDGRSLGTRGSSLSALEKLSIRTCEYGTLCALLALITSPALHTVNFDLNTFHPIDATPFRLITGPDPTGSFARRASLCHIKFHFMYPSGTDRGGLPLHTGLLDPLFTCPNLITLVVNASVFLDDADVERMASTWPRLQRLSIYNDADKPVVHIATLSILASRCPHLAEIEMSVDTRSPPRSLSPGVLPALWVRKLYLFASLLEPEEEQLVADFLNLAFPRLAEFLGSEARAEGITAPWYSVKAALPCVDWEYRQCMRDLIESGEDEMQNSRQEPFHYGPKPRSKPERVGQASK
ncbi:hypothetical protein B0H13DRAFT_1891936 [Mycena leptocephala]|nr:hypothetical protein B0H13DRAFT_1891936 [Mycena leptocephala]